MSLLELGFVCLLWGFLFSFVGNFKAAGVITTYYGHNSKALDTIRKLPISVDGVNCLRDSLSLLIKTSIKHNLNLAERLIMIFHPVLIRRVITEQLVVLNYFLELNHEGVAGIPWKPNQVLMFLNTLNGVIKKYEKVEGVQFSQVERIYVQYKVLLAIGKRYQLNDTEVFTIRTIYKELFLGVDKCILNGLVIEKLATETINQSAYDKFMIKYATMFGLKILFLYRPEFNTYGTIKKLKSQTDF